MNGSEALKHIKENNFPMMIATYPPMSATFEGYTKNELFSIIEKELKDGEKYKKALEIIKKKGIDIDEFDRHDKACTYNAHTTRRHCIGLTNEEFDFLKEVL